jgi:hypothetical protein
MPIPCEDMIGLDVGAEELRDWAERIQAPLQRVQSSA